MRNYLIILLLVFSCQSGLNDETKTSIRERLEEIYATDQVYRAQVDSIANSFGFNSPEMENHWKLIELNDSINISEVSQLLDKYGWLSEQDVGKKANSALFLVIQHSDQLTQEKYLPIMREAVKLGNALGSDLALLEDRVALGQGKPQIYGSQLTQLTSGEIFISPIIDPINVNKRRESVGLGTIEEYLSYWDLKWDLNKQEEQLKKYLEKSAKN